MKKELAVGYAWHYFEDNRVLLLLPYAVTLGWPSNPTGPPPPPAVPEERTPGGDPRERPLTCAWVRGPGPYSLLQCSLTATVFALTRRRSRFLSFIELLTLHSQTASYRRLDFPISCPLFCIYLLHTILPCAMASPSSLTS